jgi:hypothetical protein
VTNLKDKASDHQLVFELGEWVDSSATRIKISCANCDYSDVALIKAGDLDKSRDGKRADKIAALDTKHQAHIDRPKP